MFYPAFKKKALQGKYSVHLTNGYKWSPSHTKVDDIREWTVGSPQVLDHHIEANEKKHTVHAKNCLWPDSTIESDGCCISKDGELVCYHPMKKKKSEDGPFHIEWHKDGIFSI